MNDDIFWQTKLHARLHDPAEKALVLLRDPAGHEGGSSRVLHRLLGYQRIDTARVDPDDAGVLHQVLFKNGIPADIYRTVRRADWWAAAADRPQWPMQEITVQTKSGETRTIKVADWAQVRWTKSPVLIHPLTGDKVDLADHGGLSDTDITDIKSRSFEHFSKLVVRNEQETDWQKTLLAFWRFGPELLEDEDFGKLGALWKLLPADTRVPDHSIWDHLDLTSAFAGAFAGDADGEAALLALSIGPVQGFIEAARSTSDLWAGSHLLSRLAWEAMKPVAEALGPDAILFPRLRGVPQVDLWLRDECKLSEDWFKKCEWNKGGTDSNPLFSAALPNRFVAVVPRCRAEELARKVEAGVREWLQGLGASVVERLLKAASLEDDGTAYCYQQMRSQLDGFPEVHWAVVPFSLVRPRNTEKQTDLDVTALSEAMAPFFGVAAGTPCGFLDSPAWAVLKKEAQWDDRTAFFAPNPGVLYPAVYDLAERVMAAAKAARPFAQTEQKGWRCSLTGETEWLTVDPKQLYRSYRTQEDTLWAKVAREKPSWTKKGEHLGALPAVKRLWPTLFAEEVQRAAGESVSRFVVSTHTMALAYQLDGWLERGGLPAKDFVAACEKYRPDAGIAVPRKLALKHGRGNGLGDARKLLGLLERANELEDETSIREIEKVVRNSLKGATGVDEPGDFRLETYYSLVLMDGDHMGRMLGGDERFAIPYRDSFHPHVRDGFDQRATGNALLKAYGAQKRPMSPNRHMAMSSALNDFSLTVVRHVVEVEHLGRVIYAGGDDVLAMLPVADMLSAMQRLRWAYAGNDPAHSAESRDALWLSNGFAKLGGRLMRMMGTQATASCGAVIAHHHAPLAAVLRELRSAERRAKREGGRDAFSLTVVKRSGGALYLTAKWGAPVRLLLDLRRFLGDDGVSRRAVYNSMEWLKDLPQDNQRMIEKLLAYQLERQTEKAARDRHDIPGLALRLAELAFKREESTRRAYLANVLSVAEFLARETRGGA